MDLYGEMGKALTGQKYGLLDDVETFIAGCDVFPGEALFSPGEDYQKVYGAKSPLVELRGGGDLVASNNVAITINTVSIGAVVYAESTFATLTALAQLVNNNATMQEQGVTAYTLPGWPRSLFLARIGDTLSATITVTAGASQATFTSNSPRKFVGVARRTELSTKDSVGIYKKGDMVNAQTFGKIFVDVVATEDVAPGMAAYVVATGANAGKFTAVSTANFATDCVFSSNKVEGNLAILSLKGLK